MYIEDLKEGELEIGEELLSSDVCSTDIAVSDAKRALVGAGARALFYPTLLYNVVRNKVQSGFRWWDRVDEFILLGAVPFPSDVLRLKELGVGGVITLNEPYETLVPTSLYHTHSIDHLVIPTRDYLFAPSFGDICQAVDFIQKNASCGKTTYVHCKAGRGRSTTIVLCYLVQHKQMTPDAAFEWVRSIRQRVLLAPSQWHVCYFNLHQAFACAVQEYYRLSMQKTQSRSCVDLPVVKTLSFPANQDFVAFDDGSTVLVMESDLRAKKNGSLSCLDSAVVTSQGFPATRDIVGFDDGSIVLVTESDLDGYEGSCGSVGNEILEQSLGHRVQFASQTALARLSCLWLRSHARQKISSDNIGRESSCCEGTDQLGGLGVDIHVY
ncbi:hypothetical protein HHK36_000920 [Tetracentron sinense]|uniref:phosphatidylglycerophosphatase n=1 Tax=Tetracentron sinense TaxID=13715 RepID=A0A835DQG8_TETSI|nr:hypothetical protein HHK36_000920 [Tetracentron sinense]